MIVFIIHFIILSIIFFVLFIIYDKYKHNNSVYDISERIWDGIKASFAILLVVGLILDLVGDIKYFEEKTEEEITTESLYAIKDSSEINGSFSGGFLLIGGALSGEIDTELNVRYVSGNNEDGYRIKSLSIESDDISFIESNEQDPQLQITEHRVYERYNMPCLMKDFTLFINIFGMDKWKENSDRNYTTYKFIVPEGTIVYDYEIDLE